MSVWVYFVWDPLCFLYLDMFPSLSLGSFQPKFLQIYFPFPFLFFSLSRIPIMHRLAHFMLFHRTYIAFFFYFLSPVLIGWFLLFYLPDHLFILLKYSFFYLLPLAQLLSQQVKSESEVTQLCLTLCNPMDCSLLGFSIHGIFKARILEWVAISFYSLSLSLSLTHTHTHW